MSAPKRTTSYLVYRLGDGPQYVVVWDTIDIQVGRSSSQDIAIPDVEVSRRHVCFRREKDRHLVEDLGSGIGTTVNGERITLHELHHGDVIRIGAAEFTYGRTDEPVLPGANTRYASELRSRSQVPQGAEAGRTMLAIEMDDSDVYSAPTAVPEIEVARAVSADGSLEEVENDDPLGLSLYPEGIPAMDPVRDLDRELSEGMPELDTAPWPSSDLRTPAPGPDRERTSDRASGPTPPRLTMVLEIQAATFEIASLVTALYGKQIR